MSDETSPNVKKEFQKYFHQKKLFRYILFTYPKTITLVSLFAIGLLTYECIEVTKDNRNYSISTIEAIHSNDSSTKVSKFKNFVIYDSASK